MAPRSYIRVKDAAGAVKAVFTAHGRDGGENGFFYLGWKKRVNDIYFAEFEIAQDNPDAQYIVDKAQLEIVRADPTIGLAEYTALNAIIRDDMPYTNEQGQDRLVVRAYGPNSLLGRRRIAWPSSLAGMTEFTGAKGETVLKTLVKYNTDPTLTTFSGKSRDRVPNTLNLTVETDNLGGNTINWSCGGRTNLLEELRKIVLIAGGDFDVIQTGANSYQFIFKAGQLGTNRATAGANQVVFALDRGNMFNPKLIRNRSVEKTVAIIGGKGEDENRAIRIRTGPNYSSSTDFETFVDGRNTALTTSLDSLGDQALQAQRFRNIIEYTVLQTPIYSIDKDYFLGDLVLAKFSGVEVTQQVYETTFQYKDKRERVNIIMRDL